MDTFEECNGENGHKHYCSQHPHYSKPEETVNDGIPVITERLQYRPKGEKSDWSYTPLNLEFRFAPKDVS